MLIFERIFMSFQRILITTIILLGVTISAHAQRNPGQSAMQCVDAKERGATNVDNAKVFFTNTCNQDIFVIWCFTGTNDRARCGTQGKGYYSMKKTLKPGETGDTLRPSSGSLRYAACVGQIGFGNDGHFEDDSNGGFRCLRR
jgi:hypothetical protein